MGLPPPETKEARGKLTAGGFFSAFEWPKHVSSAERRTLVAGGLGWMLDAMDVMLYSMVLAHLMREMGMDKRMGGLLNSLTLLASALGGAAFGFLADRIGRTRSLVASILVYSVSSAACGFAQSVAALAFFRFVLGLGMGGEWTTGAALIAETWPPAHRGKALGLMQSTWALGEMIAAGVAGFMLPRYGWRAVFFVGIVPALLCLWVRRDVPESEVWLRSGKALKPSAKTLLRRDVWFYGILATTMNAFGMFGYWGLFTWIPAYLSLPEGEGGRGLSIVTTTTWLVAMGIGKWLGYALFGFFADGLGRRASYVTYLLVAAALVPIYGMTKTPTGLLILGPFVAFFGTGFFSGFSALTAEIFPTEIRATAMGLSYNIGRGISAAAPLLVGILASRFGLGAAFFMQAAAFLLAALLALALPETKGKVLV